jgi:hypothetical protein
LEYFENGKGEIRFPGSRHDPAPPGFIRREIASRREYDRFRKRVNRDLLREHEKRREYEEQEYEEFQKNQRSELRQMMQHFSERGKDLARAAMEYNDSKPRDRYDPGFHVDAMENYERHE